MCVMFCTLNLIDLSLEHFLAAFIGYVNTSVATVFTNVMINLTDANPLQAFIVVINGIKLATATCAALQSLHLIRKQHK